MTPELILERLQIAVAISLMLVGAAMAWRSANVGKRVLGLMIAMMGAGLTAAALGVSQSLVIAALVIGLAQLLIGAALVVRLQESYGGIEAADLDSADQDSEPPETEA